MTKLDQRILNRLEELIRLGERVLQTKYSKSAGNVVVIGDAGVDSGLANQWGTSCLNILGITFGPDSIHYKTFEAKFPKFHNFSPVKQSLGILKAAREDYEQGFMQDARTLIEAEVFDDFLEQGAHLLESGYYQPAAVVIGSVLEDGLRKLCAKQEIELSPRPKLDSMNSALAKYGAYNKLTQKRVTTLAHIRNRAAHGEWNEFTNADVEAMLRDVRQFMETHFT